MIEKSVSRLAGQVTEETDLHDLPQNSKSHIPCYVFYVSHHIVVSYLAHIKHARQYRIIKQYTYQAQKGI